MSYTLDSIQLKGALAARLGAIQYSRKEQKTAADQMLNLVLLGIANRLEKTHLYLNQYQIPVAYTPEDAISVSRLKIHLLRKKFPQGESLDKIVRKNLLDTSQMEEKVYHYLLPSQTESAEAVSKRIVQKMKGMSSRASSQALQGRVVQFV